MPRCCNENKSLRLVSSDQQHNTENILLTRPRPFSIGGEEQLDTEEETPVVVVERSHRRVRCDLSPVPTNTNSSYIKLIGIKVKNNCVKLSKLKFVLVIKQKDSFVQSNKKSNLITVSQDKSTRQEIQAKHGSGSSGHRDRDKETKKRAAIGNAVRGLFPSGHNRQDRYNDVRIKITLFTLSLHTSLSSKLKTITWWIQVI